MHDIVIARQELERRADLAAFAEVEKLVDRQIIGRERQCLNPAADASQLIGVGLERIVDFRAEAERLERDDRQRGAKRADGFAERGPLAAGGLEQAYFVFREEDEIAVLICADTALPCRFDQLIERP